jgi:hypothetical protein
MKKVRINVTKAFNLVSADGPKPFAVGIHEVDEATASHWYVKEHSEVVSDVPVQASAPKPADVPAPARSK